LEPIVAEMKRELLKADYLQVDETPVRVMGREGKGRCALGYLWVARHPEGDVIFEFHPGRGKEYAQSLIGTFKGYMQRDGYGVYGALARQEPGLIPVGCWSHARRKFVEALEEGSQAATELVTEIRALYLIERHARDQCLDASGRATLMQEIAA